MDTGETGELARLAKTLGDVIGTSVTDDSGEVEARAFHIQRPGKPDLVIAGSVASSLVVALLVPRESATVGMAAARVLANERGDQLKPGKIVSLPAGAQGSRSVRGSTGTFAIVGASHAGLHRGVDLLAVHAYPPLSEWEEATSDEVKSAVPDLVSRFRPVRSPARGGRSKSTPPKPAGPAKAKTVLRRREK
jgi:hypothetical protein